LKQTITARLGVSVYLVEQTPIPGLYMLGTSQGVLYSDAKGDYVVQGVMLDMTRDMKNLTISGMREQRRLGLAQVAHAPIVLKARDERHRVALFLGEQDAARR
ncbi:disulfide isomerase DsbC N-terminal domain-containing protein, partial [Aeromonas veronii]|uniref:disulfide isomerase DsbC N-terminal domain-containing protein n=1 Tax=Aeromonas veronii TaxID=654 RepID=UPI002AAC0671